MGGYYSHKCACGVQFRIVARPSRRGVFWKQLVANETVATETRDCNNWDSR